MPLVTQNGFQPIPPIEFTPFTERPASDAIDLPNDADPTALVQSFPYLRAIRIPFPKPDDGRGFSLARRLRDLGYRGTLRAQGAVVSDQFRYALECGFDEVEIDDDRAARQPQDHWRAAKAPSYRDRLRGRR